jgi:hypothetical protein
VTSDPKRLTVVGATDLERTLLQAARNERPSPELTARMAAGLGISVGAALTTAAAPAAAAKATASVWTGWVSAGVLAAAVTAGVVGVRMVRAPAPAPVKPAAAQVAAPAIAPPVAEAPRAPSALAVPGTRVEKVRRRAAVAATPAVAPASDLRDQIALIDAARAAVKAGSSERALVLLRRYDASYPGGAFEPESLALRIEALDQDGRHAEARTLGRDFLARYPRSPVADRVARVVQK